MKMPFSKNSHVRIIKEIAIGLNQANTLNRYLELGIRKGPAFNAVAPLVKGSAHAVDINNCKKYIDRNKNLVWYHGKTVDFLTSHNKKKKFDMVFIDADHNHKSSMEDFELVFPLVNRDDPPELG